MRIYSNLILNLSKLFFAIFPEKKKDYFGFKCKKRIESNEEGVYIFRPDKTPSGGRGRGRGGRGAGRGQGTPRGARGTGRGGRQEFIQTTGVFSEGIGQDLIKRPREKNDDVCELNFISKSKCLQFFSYKIPTSISFY